MKNKYYLSENGNILVVPEKGKCFFTSPNSSFLRFVTESEKNSLVGWLPEIDFVSKFNLPVDMPEWQYLWSVGEVVGDHTGNFHYYIRLRGNKKEYCFFFEITSRNQEQGEREIFILEGERTFRMEIEYFNTEAVLDQVATKCDFKTAFNVFDKNNGEGNLSRLEKVCRIKLLKIFGVSALEQNNPKTPKRNRPPARKPMVRKNNG
jgi:hypothetical protein